MKFLYSCIFLLALIAASQASSVTWGRRNGTDYLLSRQTERRNPIKNNQWSIYVEFPARGQQNYYTISAIHVIDNFRNSSGAAAYLMSGGPGYRYSQINLRSQVSRGVDSTIEIWGR